MLALTSALWGGVGGLMPRCLTRVLRQLCIMLYVTSVT